MCKGVSIMIDEMKQHLKDNIIPFWSKLCDDQYGGFYGYVGFDLKVNRESEKGCILNSRITWFFSNTAMLYEELGLANEELLKYAKQGYEYLKKACLDKQYGGVYWSTNFDGTPCDTTKHTYNQAFAIYALSSYYDATKDEQSLQLAMDIFNVIETKCVDCFGYLESFNQKFEPNINDKLSENGIIADKTMNTLLHIIEAYTELYRVSQNTNVRDKLIHALNIVEEKVYNKKLCRLEVFFDKEMNSLIDLHSFGHDIEASWLIDRALSVLGTDYASENMSMITKALANEVFKVAYIHHSLHNERDRGKTDTTRVWWVQAEGVIGYMNAYQKEPDRKEYLLVSKQIWNYIKEYFIDKRKGSEWFMNVDMQGKPDQSKPIVEPWKCPYHNGRMCIEIIRRNLINATS